MAAVPLPQAHAATTLTNTQIHLPISGETISFPAGGGPQTLNFSIPRIPNGTVVTNAVVSIETASQASLGPVNLSLSSGGNVTSLWKWPEGYGWTGGPSGAWLTSDNSTVSQTLELPKSANITNAQASLVSRSSDLRGDYSLQTTVGGIPVFSRSGGTAFLPPSELNWTSRLQGLTSVAIGRENNGSMLLAEGSSSGQLAVFRYSPSQPGVLVYSATLSAPFPASQLIFTHLPGVPFLVLVAISGSLVFVSEQDAGGNWGTNILSTPNSGSSSPPLLTSLAMAQYENGYPAIIAGSTSSQVYVWNWSSSAGSYGFPNPGQSLMTAPWPVSSLASYSLLGAPALLAVGGKAGIIIANLTTTRLQLLGNVTLPQNVTANALAFNNVGNLLAAGGSDGILYPVTKSLGWSLGSPLSMSSDAVVGVEFDPRSGNNTVVVDTLGNSVLVVFGLASSVSTQVSLGTISGPGSLGPATFGSLFGVNESDVAIPTPSGVWASVSTLVFNSTSISNFSESLTRSKSIAPTSTDSYGNVWSSVSVGLTADGGIVSLWGVGVTYNLTTNVSLPDLANALKVHGGNPKTWSVVLSAQSGGQVHLLIELTESVPQPPAPPTWYDQLKGIYTSRSTLFVLLVIILAGAAIFVVGLVMYTQHHPSPPAQEAPKTVARPPRRKP